MRSRFKALERALPVCVESALLRRLPVAGHFNF